MKTPLKDPQGNVTDILVILWDITEKKVAEERLTKAMAELEHFNRNLAQSEEALAEAQQIAHVGSWITNPASGEVRASAETFRIFGLDPAPVVPMQLFIDKVHPEDRSHAQRAIAASAQTGVNDVVLRISTPDGIRVVRSIFRPRDAGDPGSSMIGTTQDITEQRAVEDALRQRTESLESSNDALERFNRAAVGRELRMIELKQQVNDLCAQLGLPAAYVVPSEHALAREIS